MLKIRKFSSVFLVLLILIGGISITPISVSAAGGVEEKLNTIKSVYPSDSYFTVSGGVCNSSQNYDCELANIPSRGGLPSGATVAGVTGNAWSCCSFAKYVFYCTFGLAPSNCLSVSQSEVKIGDYMDFYSASYGHHYGIYLGQDSTNWYIYDSNFTSPPTNRIRWYGAIRKSSVTIQDIRHATNYQNSNPIMPKPRVYFEYGGNSNITENNATIFSWIVNSGNITEMGFYFGTTTLEKIKTNTNSVQWTNFYLNYNLNDVYGLLTSGQKYNYQFYIISDGEEFKSELMTFTTKGNSYITFDTYSLESLGEINAKPCVWFSNDNAFVISDIGFCYGTDRINMNKKSIIGSVSWTRAYLNYNLSDYVGRLIPNTNYYVRYYVVTYGITYYSDFINFKTNSKITYNNYNISGTKTNTIKAGVWFVNSNAYVLDEIGFLIGKNENTFEKIKTNQNVSQWTNAYLFYTLSNYYHLERVHIK